jgi:hypothetical protein
MFRVSIFRLAIGAVSGKIGSRGDSLAARGPGANASTIQTSDRGYTPDPALVSLPESVAHCCRVYRNFVAQEQEQIVWEELTRLLAKDGQTAYGGPAKFDDKAVRNVRMELYGFENFHQARDMMKMTPKNIPGLVFSATIVEIVKKKLPGLVGGVVFDSARVTEHQLPGDEMHVESPTTGNSFAYLSLLSDTVVTFDNEGEGLSGEVYLPARSLMIVNGELRWGWRWGERSEAVHKFKSKRVEPEYRFSIQMWKAQPGLVDRHGLQESLKENFKAAASEKLPADVLKKVLEKPEDTVLDELEKDKGKGLLGGDYVDRTMQVPNKPGAPGAGVAPGEARPRTLQDSADGLQRSKADFNRITQTMQVVEEKRKRGEEVSDEWMQSQFKWGSGPDPDGFDVNNPTDSWEEMGQKAMRYRNKLKAMKYTDDPEILRNAGLLPKQASTAEEVSTTVGSTGVGVTAAADPEVAKKQNRLTESISNMESYAKKLGYSKFKTEGVEQAMDHFESKGLPRLPSFPEVPGAGIEIEIPKSPSIAKK